MPFGSSPWRPGVCEERRGEWAQEHSATRRRRVNGDGLSFPRLCFRSIGVALCAHHYHCITNQRTNCSEYLALCLSFSFTLEPEREMPEEESELVRRLRQRQVRPERWLPMGAQPLANEDVSAVEDGRLCEEVDRKGAVVEWR